MRRNTIVEKGVLLFALSFLLFLPHAAAANEDNTDVKPNEYERRTLKFVRITCTTMPTPRKNGASERTEGYHV